MYSDLAYASAVVADASATDAQLWGIAAAQPGLHPVILQHPACSANLSAWIRAAATAAPAQSSAAVPAQSSAAVPTASAAPAPVSAVAEPSVFQPSALQPSAFRSSAFQASPAVVTPAVAPQTVATAPRAPRKWKGWLVGFMAVILLAAAGLVAAFGPWWPWAKPSGADVDPQFSKIVAALDGAEKDRIMLERADPDDRDFVGFLPYWDPEDDEILVSDLEYVTAAGYTYSNDDSRSEFTLAMVFDTAEHAESSIDEVEAALDRRAQSAEIDIEWDISQRGDVMVAEISSTEDVYSQWLASLVGDWMF